MEWFLAALGKYATFAGRARRKEYWMFHLFYVVILFAAAFVDAMLGAGEDGTGLVLTLVWLGTVLPSLTVGVRRMHDTGHSGWWYIVPVVSFIFSVMEGEPGPNRFGDDPKAAERPMRFGPRHA